MPDADVENGSASERRGSASERRIDCNDPEAETTVYCPGGTGRAAGRACVGGEVRDLLPRRAGASQSVTSPRRGHVTAVVVPTVDAGEKPTSRTARKPLSRGSVSAAW